MYHLRLLKIGKKMIQHQGNNMQLVAIQMTSTEDVVENLAEVAAQLARIDFTSAQAEHHGVMPTLVLLPENFALFARSERYYQHAESLGEGPVQAQLAAWAKQYQCWLVAGSFPILSDNADKEGHRRVNTTSLAFNPQGELIQYYHKIHLFDATVTSDNAKSTANNGKDPVENCEDKADVASVVYRESDSFLPGNGIATFNANGIKFGMAICYDLRFPELFRRLRELGSDVILLPAAFTYTTGKAHWLPLLQARAIENQCYVLAANQVGVRKNGKATWGHSVIVDPWGEVIDKISTDVGAVCSVINPQKLARVRADMPILQHARFTTSLKNKE